MAAVTVFVDDAVLGRLPSVCVIDGVRTTDRLTFTQEVNSRSGIGVAWLLVLAGPLGWLGLFVISALRGGEMLTVTVPYGEAAYRRRLGVQRARRQATLVMGGALLAAFFALLLRTTDGRLLALGLAVIAVGAFVKMVLASIGLRRLTVRLGLDASRRWITMAGVHPDFEDAVHHDERRSSIDSSV